jgi:proteasome lid subunit RPN8/RPN11
MPDTIRKLKRKLKAGDKVERCGLVLKNGRTFTVANQHPNPAVGFVISARDMKKHFNELAGIWHTHPLSSSHLSQDDWYGICNWPGITHYIIGRDGVRSYHTDDADCPALEVGFAAH